MNETNETTNGADPIVAPETTGIQTEGDSPADAKSKAKRRPRYRRKPKADAAAETTGDGLTAAEPEPVAPAAPPAPPARRASAARLSPQAKLTPPTPPAPAAVTPAPPTPPTPPAQPAKPARKPYDMADEIPSWDDDDVPAKPVAAPPARSEPSRPESRLPARPESRPRQESRPPAQSESQSRQESQPPARPESQSRQESRPPARPEQQSRQESQPPARPESQPRQESRPPARPESQPRQESRPPAQPESQSRQESRPPARPESQSRQESRPPARPEQQPRPFSRSEPQYRDEARPAVRPEPQSRPETRPPAQPEGQPENQPESQTDKGQTGETQPETRTKRPRRRRGSRGGSRQQARPETATNGQTPAGEEPAQTGEDRRQQPPARQESRNQDQRRQQQPARPAAGTKPAAEPAGPRHQRDDDETETDEETPAASANAPHRDMLINISQGEECRIAIVADRKLDELYVERLTTASIVGNIYKGKIVNLEPGIQACFIDFGIGQNGFLHISDVQPSYFKKGQREVERVGQKRPRDQRPPIQECFKRGDEVVVQVIKAGIGTKGPTLSTYLSIPGRYLVMMPGMNRTGISRKIEDLDIRDKMRDLIKQIELPKDVGFILRTAALGSNKRELRADLNYLMRLWKQIDEKIKKGPSPCELYQESDLVTRTLRDVFNSSIDRIVCDSDFSYEKACDFLAIAMPRSKQKVIRYDGRVPVFTKYHIEREIDQIQSRHVPLKIGGSLVIDQTEALVAIDVNSGKYRMHENAEDTALKINTEAAQEIARQLRLRDLGGVIVMDFIDMMQPRNRRTIEKVLRDAVAADRASTKILRMSQFGIIEMTRQRMKPSLKRSIYIDCPHCKGAGLIKSPESITIEVMRRLQYAIEMDSVQQIDIAVSLEVAGYLQNRKRAVLAELEKKLNKGIHIVGQPGISNDETRFVAHDRRGIEVPIDF